MCIYILVLVYNSKTGVWSVPTTGTTKSVWRGKSALADPVHGSMSTRAEKCLKQADMHPDLSERKPRKSGNTETANSSIVQWSKMESELCEKISAAA